MRFWRREWRWALALLTGFFLVYYLPVAPGPRALDLPAPLAEALLLARWYAREHVVLCLVPAFFIAGAIGVFVRQDAVLRYLGPRAPKALAYGVASVSGGVLAVCSCTVLPLFAGIYARGAGLGPATAFLYAGPAINVLAVALTARVLGLELGVARAAGAVAFSLVIGLAMHGLFRREERARAIVAARDGADEPAHALFPTALFVGSLVGILVFANWRNPVGGGLAATIYSMKWMLTSLSALVLAGVLVSWFGMPLWRVVLPGLAVAGIGIPTGGATLPFAAGALSLSATASTREGDPEEWFAASWTFAKQILPLLLLGVLVAGLLLGRPGHEGLLPGRWVSAAVGGNSLVANAVAAVLGAFMYFATLTEVPIVEGLRGAGMGEGPALALLLAGPAVSLPSLLVIRSVLGTRKTATFAALVVGTATLTGWLFGFATG